MEKDKTETVYIKSDAEGNTKEITVETMLKHPTTAPISRIRAI